MINEQKINSFIDLQIKANRMYKNYGEIPILILDQLDEVSKILTVEEIEDAFIIFMDLADKNKDIIRAELN